MELNAETVKKALDWLDILAVDSIDGEIAMFTYQLLGILYDTCEELTEKNAIQTITAIELDKQVQRLTEENERLKSLCEAKDDIINKIAANSEEIGIVAIRAISETKADTVQKYRECLHRELASLEAKDKFNKEFFLTKADKIAKEMVESTNEDN